MANGDDKTWIRLCLTLGGFRNEYGRWPTQVRLGQAALDDLRDQLFSSKRWARIASKVMFVVDNDVGFVADDDGASFEYGSPSGDVNFEAVHGWLGGPDHPWGGPRFTERAAFTVDGSHLDCRGGPAGWREHCRAVAAIHLEAAALRHVESEVKICVRFYVPPSKRRRRDLDKMIETILDALGGAGLFKPTSGRGTKTPWNTADHWLCGIDAERHVDADRPRVEIEVWVQER